MSKAASADAPQQQIQTAETTYFVMINDLYEIKAAKEYIRSIYPGTAAKIVHELRLDRLTDKHTVVALVREHDATPAVQVRPNTHGIKELYPTPITELAREVRERKPIAVADFWHPGEGGEGEVDLAGFLEALGKQCSPAAIKYIPSQGMLRLGFA